MNTSRVQKDIEDMNNKITALCDVVSSLDGVVQTEYIQAIEAVVDEWQSYTKDAMNEMLAELEA
tara:strand:- start:22680 stop:22871 length:192 start_codon:yes stop_codon:yes gene_type:complete